MSDVSVFYFIRRFWVSYILFIIIIGGILVLFIYITRLASNEIFPPSNKIHREVGRAKDLSAPLYFRVQMCCGSSRNKVYCTADLLPCTQQILRHNRRTFPRMKVVAPYSSCRRTFSHRCCFNTLFQMKVLIIQWKHLKLKTGLKTPVEERPVCVGPRCQQTVCHTRRRRSMAVH